MNDIRYGTKTASTVVGDDTAKCRHNFISCLHYNDKKVFPFEKFVTKLKENFHVLSKDKIKALSEKQMVDKMLLGVHSTDTSIASAKVIVYQNYRSDFDEAVEFMSGLVSSIHAVAQLDYANQHSGNKR